VARAVHGGEGERVVEGGDEARGVVVARHLPRLPQLSHCGVSD